MGSSVVVYEKLLPAVLRSDTGIEPQRTNLGTVVLIREDSL